MTRIIPTKFPNTVCRVCKKALAYGENVCWTKGEKGVTCMACAPTHAVSPPTNAQATAYEALARRFDGQSQILATVQAERDMLRMECIGLRAEVARLNSLLTAAFTTGVVRPPAFARQAIPVMHDPNCVNPSCEYANGEYEGDSGEYEAVAAPLVETDDCPI